MAVKKQPSLYHRHWRGGGGGEAAAEEGPSFEELYASADPAAGEKVFSKCKACHKVDGSDGTGPHLNGVVDRAKASVEGFAYSDVLKGMAADSWTPENLDAFLTNPKAYAPGTKMALQGLPKPADRANLIAWLATQQLIFAAALAKEFQGPSFGAAFFIGLNDSFTKAHAIAT